MGSMAPNASMQDGWSERGPACSPGLESDTHCQQFAKMMGFAKGSTHPPTVRYSALAVELSF
jgi:hypothetical protein